ncbi:MAG TPA: DUF6777 domain-containing protein [Fimbriimonadales bacterium]|nr:DUF6777 domain-containing protein [Fimbriimonadales bacterium]
MMWNKGKLLWVVFSTLMAGTLFAQMPPGAFLVRPAYSKAALINQVRNEPKVMESLMRHFQMTEDEVISMLRTLKLETLKEDIYVQQAGVSATTGELRLHKAKVKKGTKVWVDKNGNPVLVANCGNPVARYDKASAPSIEPVLGGGAAERPLEAGGGIVEEMYQTTLLEPLLPEAPRVEFVTVPTPEEIVSEGGMGEAPFLPALGLLPSLLLAFDTGGGIIPEPGTIFILSAGMGLLALRLKRKK